MKKTYKIIAIILIQAFIYSSIAWASNCNIKSSTLSPKVYIDTRDFKNTYYNNYDQKDQSSIALKELKSFFEQQVNIFYDSLADGDKYIEIERFEQTMLERLKQAYVEGVSNIEISRIWTMTINAIVSKIAESVIGESNAHRVAVIVLGSGARGSDFTFDSDIDVIVLADTNEDMRSAEYYEQQIQYGLQTAGFKFDRHLSELFINGIRTPERLPERFAQKEQIFLEEFGMEPIETGVNPIITTFFFDTDIVYGNEEIYHRMRQVVQPHLSSTKSAQKLNSAVVIDIEEELLKDINQKPVYTTADLEKMDIKKRFLRNIQLFIWINRVRYGRMHGISEERDIVKIIDILSELDNAVLTQEEAARLKAALEFGIGVRNGNIQKNDEFLQQLAVHLHNVDLIIGRHLDMPKLSQASFPPVTDTRILLEDGYLKDVYEKLKAENGGRIGMLIKKIDELQQRKKNLVFGLMYGINIAKEEEKINAEIRVLLTQLYLLNEEKGFFNEGGNLNKKIFSDFETKEFLEQAI